MEHHVYCLDVGHSMSQKRDNLKQFGSYLEAAHQALSFQLKNKLLYSPKHHVGIFLFGTDDEDNPYELTNARLLAPIEPVSLELLRSIEQLEHQNGESDFLDGYTGGLAMLAELVEKVGAKKVKPHLHLITDCHSTSSDGLEQLIDSTRKLGVAVRILGVGVSDDDDDDDGTDAAAKQTVPEGHITLKAFAEQTQAEVFNFKDVAELVADLRKRSVKPTTAYRGTLDIADVKIPTYCYYSVKRATVPTLSKLSGVANYAPGNPSAGAVDREVTYHLDDEQNTEIDKDDRQRAYRYGSTLVPWPEDDAPNLKVEMDKGLRVLCFTAKANVPRSSYLGDSVGSILPPAGDDNAYKALSALSKAMVQTGAVAIASFVYRAKANPKLLMIYPRVFTDDDDDDDDDDDEDDNDDNEQTTIKASYLLQFVQLPFSECTRNYQFPPLKMQPSAEQMKAMSDFIDSMDLMNIPTDDGLVEGLAPDDTFNPAVQMYDQAVIQRALHPDEPLNDLDPLVAQYIEPNELLVKKSKPLVDTLKELFPLRVVPKKGKRTAADVFGDTTAASKAANQDTAAGAPAANFSLNDIMGNKITKVGTATPVQDYMTLLGRTDEDNLVRASKELANVIIEYVATYTSGSLDAFVEMVKALRRETKTGQPAIYNEFAQRLKDMIDEDPSERGDFWKIIVDNKLGLVSSQESSDSTVDEAQASSFLSQDGATQAAAPQNAVMQTEDDDVDFDNL
eukprot:TRINITY_DN12057_c4_g1_i5.p1 TRINITY_DN12057_c4_g1~~TRINITY_DN12057_c4_g1_i5.p1  ORF type:complete len:733 (+),score=248.24 TRINITY_DN12057_c4_g1_i5:50-2248(+)